MALLGRPAWRAELAAVRSNDRSRPPRRWNSIGLRLTVKSGLDALHHAAFAVWLLRWRSSAPKLAKHSALLRTSSAIVAQDVLPLGELGHGSARLPVPPVQEAEAFRG